MKKFFAVLIVLWAAAAVFAQQRLALDAALGGAVSYLSRTLPRNTSVLALKLGAPSDALSDYASDVFTARQAGNGVAGVPDRRGHG
ncbi:MAG: hypothetical protein LBK08_14185 [Treponema sp.]|jgi:hypothetical protein|nr:hypothetical protein [Treponema sp.]